ncbi:DUF1919 domain-containing protein [Enterococcus durans]
MPKGEAIISNNCWGGHVYRYFGMKYLSPAIGYVSLQIII